MPIVPVNEQRTFALTKSMIWTILGVSVAIVAVFCISVAETLVGKPLFELNRQYIAAVLAAFGIAAWFVGRYLGKRRHDGFDSQTDEGEPTSKNFVLLDLRYWGPMLLALGVITLFIRPLRPTQVVAAVPPREAPKAPIVPKVAAVAPSPATNAPVRFPPLKMQGVIFDKSRPCVIINGRSYTVGDHVGEVSIKAIDRTGVLLELAGRVKRLTLN